MKNIRIYAVVAVLGAAATLVSCCGTTTSSAPTKPVAEGKEGPVPKVQNPGPRYGTGQ